MNRSPIATAVLAAAFALAFCVLLIGRSHAAGLLSPVIPC
jgi:hypothetical protein